VGLVASRIEAAGLSTVCLSNVPDLTVAVGVPRVVALEHPFGRTLGEPGDVDGQMAALRAIFQAACAMDRPVSVEHLPSRWQGSGPLSGSHPPVPPPIATYLKRHPWHIPNFVTRRIPG
jgi:hypothetical protein